MKDMTTSFVEPGIAPHASALIGLTSTFVMMAAVNIVLAATNAVWWPLVTAFGCVVVATWLCWTAVGDSPAPSTEEPRTREFADLSPGTRV